MGLQFVPQALEVDAENLLWPEYLADNPDNYGIFNPSHCHYKQASSGHKLKKGKMTTFGMVCLAHDAIFINKMGTLCMCTAWRIKNVPLKLTHFEIG